VTPFIGRDVVVRGDLVLPKTPDLDIELASVAADP
jgi:hypothetical protein